MMTLPIRVTGGRVLIGAEVIVAVSQMSTIWTPPAASRLAH
jgi:hypothetical protein